MIKPNWDKFRAKFSDNPQNNFEWFCYLLFCKEFNKPFGIFRYKNQSAIETNPIKKESEIIGWQAKFFDISISKYKKEIIDSINRANKDYPDLTKLLFYTNKEWGQYKGKKPKGLIEIENLANELNIKLVWKAASFFESEFVSIKNEVIAKHFFSMGKSSINLIEEQIKHTENILDEIQTFIDFNNQVFEIDRNGCLDKLNNETQQISILSGIGGVGKTVLIKKLYEQLRETLPFYVFKATEFELRNITDFFSDFSFSDFIDIHNGEEEKIIVIDSAEKILDLKNTDSFKEFLISIIKNKWKIIFTTRDNYLEVLNYEFLEIYNLAPLNIYIKNLNLKELTALSDDYHFNLPKDEKLLELIKNPFHLNEYLKFYKDKEELDYSGFKNKLWNKNIKKSKPDREQCFLRIASERANNGQFFISPKCKSDILDQLTRDGILGNETAGYFITHDIYEEWALERIIDSEFIKKHSNNDFFNKIGQSLPIRRSLRNWISEKLLLKNKDIKSFIEDVIGNEEVSSFWKDEIFVSVLLSDYAKTFFDIFKDELLADNQHLLEKLTFILRIACKEVDDNFFKQLGIKHINPLSLKYVFTKPKGQGWQNLIKFIFNNLNTIGTKNVNFILPVIHDWNNKFKEGETTRLSSLVALKYYQWVIKEKVYFYRDDTKDKLLQTILNGCSEIKTELKNVFQKVLSNNWKYHRDPYYDLSKCILTTFDGIPVTKVLPEYVFQLADLFWIYTPKKDGRFPDYSMGVDQYFNIKESVQDYFPSSSYQTPVYWSLQSSLDKTIDYILKFTNKTVEFFAKSDFAKHEVEEIEVYIEKDQVIKQYICNRLWCMYRGTQASPNILESIHMALEKFFLERGKHADSTILENWLLYLLKKSKSASISAVVASIVLAYPDTTFNVAKVLFRTKDFFLYDTNRLVLDQTQKTSLLALKNSFGVNYKNEIYENERIKACDDKHRKFSLEHMFLNYQCFRSEGVSEKEADNRQEELWKMLDNYYKKLPIRKDKTESDKTWRLFLARMDRRKMSPTTEKTDDGIAIYFNPEIDPDLKEYSEKSLAENIESIKYTTLRLWADHKLNKDDKCKQYEKYEKNPRLAIKEAKDIVEKLKKNNQVKNKNIPHPKEKSFFLLNYSVPAYVCSVLIRDYYDEINKKEINFCKNIVLDVASSVLIPDYQYQMSDGTQPTISVLPVLLKAFPKDKEKIKTILLFSLFNDYPIDMASTSFNAFAILAIHKLWKNNFNDAHSLLLGYLALKTRYTRLRLRIRDENYKKGNYEIDKKEILERFLNENQKELQMVIENKLTIDDIGDIGDLELSIQKTAFQLIPNETDNSDHQKIIEMIIFDFASQLLSDDSDEKVDYKIKREFYEKYTFFVLSSPKQKIKEWLKPFLDNSNRSESIADLLKEFVLAEDRLECYENFWAVWSLFKDKIIEICKDGDSYWSVDKIVKSYLFARVSWKDTAKEWHTLKDKDKTFFKEISQNIGHCPSTLYSISKLLNGIGSCFIEDGIKWVSNMLDKNPDLINKKLEVNTVFYIENMVKKYIYQNREKVRRTKTSKDRILIILNFLIDKGSVVGYMLRETIL